MTFIDSDTSRNDLQAIIIGERDLYSSFDEQKFLNDGYSDEELRTAICNWIEAGDETAF